MFIAMNQFTVIPERAADFETLWRTRESHLQGLKGFVQFSLLRGDEPGDYLSHTIWESREDFIAWTASDAFRQAHAARTPDGILAGHPRARFYEAVIVESGSRSPA
ncbi:MAG: antibiotic biosynthesis monooxygenase [Chloroflexi bacterium]|nr:antibiotic biosynthesis monooxygenase [Chloroflexota bacterium]